MTFESRVVHIAILTGNFHFGLPGRHANLRWHASCTLSGSTLSEEPMDALDLTITYQNRLGYHYFADALHYRELDLQTCCRT